jgi:hypothetical protein
VSADICGFDVGDRYKPHDLHVVPAGMEDLKFLRQVRRRGSCRAGVVSVEGEAGRPTPDLAIVRAFQAPTWLMRSARLDSDWLLVRRAASAVIDQAVSLNSGAVAALQARARFAGAGAF